MISPVRKELLRAPEELSESCPDYRLGQLIANLCLLSEGPHAESIWDVDDEELLTAAQKHIKDWRERHVSGA
jgi:hypothetical protein